MERKRKPVDQNVKLSKALSWLLRHGAEKEGFTFMQGGFLYLEDILKHPKFQNVSCVDIERIVETNEKQRFALETDVETGKLKIRANQGHSLQVDGLDLTAITDAAAFPTVVHGTNQRAFNFIAKQGLKRMRRNHIHFASGEPEESGVISGMRQSCSVLIFINLEKALKDGFQFMQSANGVILCPGNEEGILPPAYFDKVLDRDSRQKLSFSKELPVPSTSASTTEQASLNEVEARASNINVSADDLADELDGCKRKGRRKK